MSFPRGSLIFTGNNQYLTPCLLRFMAAVQEKANVLGYGWSAKIQLFSQNLFSYSVDFLGTLKHVSSVICKKCSSSFQENKGKQRSAFDGTFSISAKRYQCERL